MSSKMAPSGVAPNELHFVGEQFENHSGTPASDPIPDPDPEPDLVPERADATRALLFTVKRNLTEFQFSVASFQFLALKLI